MPIGGGGGSSKSITLTATAMESAPPLPSSTVTVSEYEFLVSKSSVAFVPTLICPLSRSMANELASAPDSE